MQRRIVSLVPSLTETLVELGLRDELIACTTFCTEPPDLHRTAAIVGGTKDFSVEKILSLKPSHILVNQEENPRLTVEELARHHAVCVTFPKGPEDVAPMLQQIGNFLDVHDMVSPWAEAITRKLLELRQTSGAVVKEKFLYFIWQKPYMLAGRDTYISRLLSVAGFENAYAGADRYPTVELEDIKKLEATQIFLSSEPYPFRRRDALALQKDWPEVPAIFRVDGRILSWYGTTTLRALELLVERALPKKAENHQLARMFSRIC